MVATKTFRIDGLVAGLAIKAPCIAVTTGPITLSGEQTVNSVAVVEFDRVLVKDQDDAEDNGIYDVETGAWTRSGDFDGNRDATNGTLVVYAKSSSLVGFYQLTATNPVVIGTTALTFTLVATLDLAGVLASTANNKGASQVAIEDSGSLITATTVEAALAEFFDTPSATTSRLLELATQAEVDAGTDAVRAVTPTTLMTAAGYPVTKFLAADDAKTTDNSLANDASLSGFVIPANKHYRVRGLIRYNQNVGNFQMKFVYSQSAQSGSWIRLDAIDETLVEKKFFAATTFGGTFSFTTLTDTDDVAVLVDLVFQAHATLAGVLDFQWAQSTSSANATTLREGSWLNVTKLG